MPPLSQPVFKQVLKMIGDTKVKREKKEKKHLEIITNSQQKET